MKTAVSLRSAALATPFRASPRAAVGPNKRFASMTRSAAAAPLPDAVVESVLKSVDAEPLSSHTTQGGHGVDVPHHASPDGGSVFFMPTLSYMGRGALESSGAKMKALGLKKALVVTDAVLNKVGAVAALTDLLTKLEIGFVVFDGVEPNPTVAQVQEGVEIFKKEGCDFVISFGGGSPHDAAKGIAIVASNGGDIRDYEGVDRMTAPMTPLVAVNTTAGTASEMTRFAIITDTARHVKMAIIDARCTPLVAVNDPLLMLGMPKGLTAATGLDALTHAVEAYVSTASTPVTDAAALHAIRLISRHLVTAVEEPRNMEAREQMAYAEFLAGMAFNSASLGAVHAMAHQLGGTFNLAHGVCNALLLPGVQAFNAARSEAARPLFIDIAEAMGLCLPASVSPDEAAAAVVAAIRELGARVGIPRNIEALGVSRERFDAAVDDLTKNALKDACGFTNPVPLEYDDVRALFVEAFEQ